MSKDINITMQITKNSDTEYSVCIGEENSSRATYLVKDLSEVHNRVQEYIDNYVKPQTEELKKSSARAVRLLLRTC